jgi:hypothetical protein
MPDRDKPVKLICSDAPSAAVLSDTVALVLFDGRGLKTFAIIYAPYLVGLFPVSET